MDTLTPAQPDAATEALDATVQPDGTQAPETVIDEPQDVELSPEPQAEDQPKADDDSETGAKDDDAGKDDDSETESRNQRRRRLARERETARTQELEAAKARVAALETKLSGVAPRVEDFDTEAEYTAALASHSVRKELDTDAKAQAETQVQSLHTEAQAEWEERAADMRDAALKKYTDFDEKVGLAVAMAQTLPNPAVEAAIREDDGADLAYWLGNNPEEARRIMAKPPYQAAIDLGRISAAIPQAKPKTTSTAPPPITPVRGSNGQVGATLDRLREEAARTGDMTKVVAYKRANPTAT